MKGDGRAGYGWYWVWCPRCGRLGQQKQYLTAGQLSQRYDEHQQRCPRRPEDRP